MKIGKLPYWAQLPAYWAIRGAMSAPLLAGPAPSLHTARRLGRAYGGAKFNRERLKRASDHLGIAFPEWSVDRREAVALAGYEHLAMLAVEVAFTGRLLTPSNWRRHVEFGDISPALRALCSGRPMILISGHCGNWEVLGYTLALLGFPMHALYRPLDLEPLDRWMRETRSRRGLRLIDKFGAVHLMPAIMRSGEPIGFIADQNGGDRGISVPFFGRLANTYKSIALLAMQFEAVVICGQARRIGWHEPGVQGPGDALDHASRARIHDESEGFRFVVELDDIFGPEDYLAQPDPIYYLSARYRRSIERMIRRAPSDYLWMHRSWRSRPAHERLNKPFPDKLRNKLRSLPWMTDDQLENLVDRSDRDRALLAELGTTRLP